MRETLKDKIIKCAFIRTREFVVVFVRNNNGLMTRVYDDTGNTLHYVDFLEGSKGDLRPVYRTAGIDTYKAWVLVKHYETQLKQQIKERQLTGSLVLEDKKERKVYGVEDDLKNTLELRGGWLFSEKKKQEEVKEYTFLNGDTLKVRVGVYELLEATRIFENNTNIAGISVNIYNDSITEELELRIHNITSANALLNSDSYFRGRAHIMKVASSNAILVKVKYIGVESNYLRNGNGVIYSHR